MSDQMMKYLDKYNEVFENGFPTIPLLLDGDEEKCIEIIENCLKENKDVEEMGYYKSDNSVMY